MTEYTPRPCGDCTLCCKVMAVKELNKPHNSWCPHCIKSGGCGIYEIRPEICRSFFCLWAYGVTPERFKPNKIKVVIAGDQAGSSLLVYEDKDYPLAFDTPELKHLYRLYALKGVKTVVRRADNTYLLWDDQMSKWAKLEHVVEDKFTSRVLLPSPLRPRT